MDNFDLQPASPETSKPGLLRQIFEAWVRHHAIMAEYGLHLP